MTARHIVHTHSDSGERDQVIAALFVSGTSTREIASRGYAVEDITRVIDEVLDSPATYEGAVRFAATRLSNADASYAMQASR